MVDSDCSDSWRLSSLIDSHMAFARSFSSFAQCSLFPQFCINIANEQLQFYFNQHIFAYEQQVYAREGIDCEQVAFYDNRDILDMVLQKPSGLFALLDEESRFPRATPASLVRG